MSTPDIYERVSVLEDEVKLQDSTLDARTRTLWQAIQKIQAELEQLKSAQQRGEK